MHHRKDYTKNKNQSHFVIIEGVKTYIYINTRTHTNRVLSVPETGKTFGSMSQTFGLKMF